MRPKRLRLQDMQPAQKRSGTGKGTRSTMLIPMHESNLREVAESSEVMLRIYCRDRNSSFGFMLRNAGSAPTNDGRVDVVDIGVDWSDLEPRLTSDVRVVFINHGMQYAAAFEIESSMEAPMLGGDEAIPGIAQRQIKN
jgi:hypothetical protein